MFPGILSGKRGGMHTLTRQGRRIALVAERSPPRAAAALLRSVQRQPATSSLLWRRERGAAKPFHGGDQNPVISPRSTEEYGMTRWRSPPPPASVPRNPRPSFAMPSSLSSSSRLDRVPEGTDSPSFSSQNHIRRSVGRSGRGSVDQREAPAAFMDRGGHKAAELDYARDLDPVTGESLVQRRFNALVFNALLRYGPPLPTVVLEQYAASPSRPCYLLLTCDLPGRLRRKVEQYHKDTASAFLFFDEVRLKPHQLLALVQKESPSFHPKRDAGGVPFSLLIRNCSYLQAFGGYVTYMRYLRPHVEKILGEMEAEHAVRTTGRASAATSRRGQRDYNDAEFTHSNVSTGAECDEQPHENPFPRPPIRSHHPEEEADTSAYMVEDTQEESEATEATGVDECGDVHHNTEDHYPHEEEGWSGNLGDATATNDDEDDDFPSVNVSPASSSSSTSNSSSRSRYRSFQWDSNGDSFLLLTIGQYKFREMPSQDGIRCGPQPWLYSARQV